MVIARWIGIGLALVTALSVQACSASGTAAKDSKYGTLEDLRKAVQAAGVRCSAFGAQGLALSFVADAGTCQETPITMLTFATEQDKQQNIDHNAKIAGEGSLIHFRLIGANWIIDAGVSDSVESRPDTLDQLQESLGGTVWIGGQTR